MKKKMIFVGLLVAIMVLFSACPLIDPNPFVGGWKANYLGLVNVVFEVEEDMTFTWSTSTFIYENEKETGTYTYDEEFIYLTFTGSFIDGEYVESIEEIEGISLIYEFVTDDAVRITFKEIELFFERIY